MDMEKIFDKTRKLALDLQKCDQYIEHQQAKKLADADDKLQDMIGEFNLKKVALSNELQRAERDDAKIAEANDAVKSLYNEIMQYPQMIAYNTTKEELNKVVNFMQQIILYAANGEDPYTVEESSCTGSCASCSGCH